jgi:NADH:ubiquinone oxidoreductase subunit 6 (subunit J)
LMLWNLTKLTTAVNLIYALLHFLFFAILSGLLIIFWGSVYIGFCVLLIYGAAIPVLALYIIMLVNVDLIQ